MFSYIIIFLLPRAWCSGFLIVDCSYFVLYIAKRKEYSMKPILEKILSYSLLLADMLMALLLTLLVYSDLMWREPSKGWVSMWGNSVNFYTQTLFVGALLASTIFLGYYGFCLVNHKKRIGYLCLVLPLILFFL